MKYEEDNRVVMLILFVILENVSGKLIVFFQIIYDKVRFFFYNKLKIIW